MSVFIIVSQCALWIWFLGCVTTYRFGKVTLVDGMGVRSAECFMLCLYTLGAILYHCLPVAGRWILLAILLFWFTVQFLCHWRYTLFGASAEKLRGYNDCFRDTLRIFPASDERLIPDLYHIVLHLLILLNMVLCAMGQQ